jgi:hypothetical protein
MKMVKSLLLGSAAGIVAIASAQAADLPVKAKAVEYVKVCSLYGAGFYYMPGTDTCLKVGGYIRAQYETGASAGGVAQIMTGDGAGTRDLTRNIGWRARGDVTLDARTQSAYGTIRSYARFGQEMNDGVKALHYDRAFIQFAGFTFGLTQSFYDFLSLAPYNYSNPRIGSDTGAVGVMVAAYTAQFGNGLSATIALEQSRTPLVMDAAAITATTVSTTTTDNAALNKAFDVVANVRVDQAWGSAQVMAAAHDASAGYYGTANSVINGTPGDKWGYAVGAGLQLNVPGMKGDIVAAQVNYSKGAIGYTSFVNANFGKQTGGGVGGDLGFGYVTDGVFGASPTPIEQTTAWGFTAVYQHLWSPALRTSVYGGYTAINYNANADAILCAAQPGVESNCSNDFSFWQVGTRTAWFPHPDLELGLDVMYTKLNTANEGTTSTGASISTVNSLVSRYADQDVVSVMMRVQRSFLP